MEVKIINFKEIKMALIEHRGSQEDEYNTVNKLIKWKIENKLFELINIETTAFTTLIPKIQKNIKIKLIFAYPLTLMLLRMNTVLKMA